MIITNIHHSNFTQQNKKSPQAAKSTAQNNAKSIPSNKQIVSTQPTEYKRINRNIQHSSNPFLAQYIDQANPQRRRAFIGRKPAWQAKKTYQNSQDILEFSAVSYLDKCI